MEGKGKCFFIYLGTRLKEKDGKGGKERNSGDASDLSAQKHVLVVSFAASMEVLEKHILLLFLRKYGLKN